MDELVATILAVPPFKELILVKPEDIVSMMTLVEFEVIESVELIKRLNCRSKPTSAENTPCPDVPRLEPVVLSPVPQPVQDIVRVSVPLLTDMPDPDVTDLNTASFDEFDLKILADPPG